MAQYKIAEMTSDHLYPVMRVNENGVYEVIAYGLSHQQAQELIDRLAEYERQLTERG